MIETSPIAHSVIALLTDFGSEDGYAGTMKGVIAGIAPDAHVIDLTHEIAPQRVEAGAWVLASAYRYFPAKTVFVCVVDPGVGSSRQAVAFHAGEWYFVGPDNGLFHFVLAEQPVHQAVMLTNAAYHPRQVSATFQGRDIFAPVGAYLARSVGRELADMGTAIDPATLQLLNIAPPTRKGAAIEARIIHIDHFGNLITNVPLSMLPDLFNLAQVKALFPGSTQVVKQRRRFFSANDQDEAAAGQPFIYADSSGYIGIAIRNGNAARELGAVYGRSITFVTYTR